MTDVPNSTVYALRSDETNADGLWELPLFSACAGDDGYFVTPYREVCFLTRFCPRADAEFTTPSLLLPIAGMKIGDKAYLAVFEGMKWDARVCIRVQEGHYSLSCVYDPAEIDWYEAPSARVYMLTGDDADYSGMARLYRKLQVERLGLKTIRERMQTHDALAYAADNMPVIRIRMGWKPVPSPVLEQTVATEPDMFTACTFRDVEALVDEMRQQGIEKAELVLVGWNKSGHDGRWPQAFPVEEKLGGEAGLAHLIEHAQAAGYRIVCHTNCNDAYRIADCFDEELLMRNKRHELRFDSAGWGGGRMYDMCLTPSEPIHAKVLDRLAQMGMRGFHYVDVLSIVQPRTCFHPAHPLSAQGYVDMARRILASVQHMFGGVSSEGGMDFAAGSLDFALYISFNLMDGRPELADESIPLWQLVYHGYILSNASAETVNCMVKDRKYALKALEYGSVPTVYYYSRFVGGDRKNWMGDNDMRMSAPDEMRQSVQRLKAYLDFSRPFAHLQLLTMEKHEQLADCVYQVTYAEGWRMLVNYTACDYVQGNATVGASSAVLLHD